MAACPNCQTELPDDFGLLECSNCRASVFVGMDGEVIQGGNADPSSTVEAQQQPVDNFGIEAEEQEQAAYVAQEIPQENQEQIPENTQENNWQVNSTEEAFAEVVNFGNQDTVYQQDGPLSYIVTLSGIDSTDLENRLKEALGDKRLIIDVDQLWPTLKNGQLKLLGLSPVKTYVLISKIYELPISVEWEQHVLSE